MGPWLYTWWCEEVDAREGACLDGARDEATEGATEPVTDALSLIDGSGERELRSLKEEGEWALSPLSLNDG